MHTKLAIPDTCAKFSRLGWTRFATKVRELSELSSCKNAFLEAVRSCPEAYNEFCRLEQKPPNPKEGDNFEAIIQAHTRLGKPRNEAILLGREAFPQLFNKWSESGNS